MKRLTILLLLAIVFAACTHNVREVDSMLVLDVENIKPETRDIPISELAEDVEVIPLEAADDAFFCFRKAAFSPNYIVIKDENNRMRLFHRDGHFIGKLDALGNRQFVYDIVIDEEHGAIYASIVASNVLAVFDLNGRHTSDVPLNTRQTKAVLATCEKGIAMAQFDFSDYPSGFNATVVGSKSPHYASHPALYTNLIGASGTKTGFNEEIFAHRMEGRFTFMATFCDTLFRYDPKANRIVPELAINYAEKHNVNGWEHQQNPSEEFNWVQVTALPQHFIVKIIGPRCQDIIVDCKTRTAFHGNVVCDVPGLEAMTPVFADGYGYVILPATGLENATIVRWKLGESAKPLAAVKLPDRTSGASDITQSVDTAFDMRSAPEAALQVINAAIARSGAKLGHPSLAYAYAVKGAIMTQLEQYDSALFYQQLVNAPLTHFQNRDINHRMMEVLAEQGDYQEAQRYAIAYGAESDEAQGTQYIMQMTENRAHISQLNDQMAAGSRLRAWLLAALATVIVLSVTVLIYIRYRKRQQLRATRRELQTLMEQRIAEAEKRDDYSRLRSELLANHAIIRRISTAKRPLTDTEEDILHRITEMLYPGLASRLQQQAVAPLTKRELTICFLFRFGVPQPSIATLLEWKPATFRVAKSRLKRDRLHLPADAELEDFVCGL